MTGSGVEVDLLPNAFYLCVFHSINFEIILGLVAIFLSK